MLTDIDHTHAPGCFQSALMCIPESAECSTCVFVASCAPVSLAKRQALHARFGIIAKAPVKKVKPITQVVKGPVLVSKAAQSLIGSIERADLKVATLLRAGTNPFVKTPQFMRVSCHLLLRIANGVDRNTLVTAFMSKLNLLREDAMRRSAIAFEVLAALGAAEEINGRLVLKK